jgi:hypothetical protein
MCTDDGAVDDRTGVVDLELQLPEDGGPEPASRPVGEAVVDRLPRTESLRQVTPGRASFGAIKDRLDEETVAAHRNGSRSLTGQDTLEAMPLRVRERVSVHRDF